MHFLTSTLPRRYPWGTVAISALIWIGIYISLPDLSRSLVNAMPIIGNSSLSNSLEFFFYDTPKVLLLLTAVVFVMGIINSYFTPEHTRKILMGRREGGANVMAASLGIVTPFCSCSAVPLFIGFVQAGIPLGVTFSFLIAAPMVNEIALTLLFGMFGWKVALLYLGLGLFIAIAAGFIIGKLGMEKHLQDWVQKLIQKNNTKKLTDQTLTKITMSQRLIKGVDSIKEIVGRVWIYIIIGIAIGAVIHGYVPQHFMVAIMGKDAWWSVPVAVVIGIPLYANAAGVIPIVQALLAKGAALGTVLAFMMSVIALSFPEMVILKKVLKIKLIAAFIAVVASGILLVGFVFNLVL